MKRCPGLVLVLLLLAHPFSAWGQRGTTSRVSVATGGGQSSGVSSPPSISADGRFVAFSSTASNLVPGDTNGNSDVFVHDRLNGQTARVSEAPQGLQSNGWSDAPAISADGRFVAFTSRASNLVTGDTNGAQDVFVYDRHIGITSRVSVSTGGGQVTEWSSRPSISGDGRFVAFESYCGDLVSGDTNSWLDVFVHDRIGGQTSRVSISSGGGQAVYGGHNASISADGHVVVFASDDSSLVPDDTNFSSDVFAHDRSTGQTSRVSVGWGGQANSSSDYPSLSADGRYVAFLSSAWNLVTGDTNSLRDAFVRDRQNNQTSRVSVGGGGQGNGESSYPSISCDGRFVAFPSMASNLVPDDTNTRSDLFVHDRLTGQTSRVSVITGGGQGNGESNFASVSADARFVAFHSWASNLVPGDTNGTLDVFVHQYGSGDGWGMLPPGSGGNTNGDPIARERENPPPTGVPIVLVHGIALTDNLVFSADGEGYHQWDDFLQMFLAFYGPLGYTLNENLFVFSYYTSLPVNLSAANLENDIANLRTIKPAMANAERFLMVGYSMGGLVARRWEQRFDNALLFAKKLGGLVTVNTPHAGSDLAYLATLAGLVMPSVWDLTPVVCDTFNRRNRGLLGTRYGLVASDLNYIFLRDTDGVVSLSSQTNTSWLGAGTLAFEETLFGYGHIAMLGRPHVLRSEPTVRAVWDALFGAGGSVQGEPESVPTQPNLQEAVLLLPGPALERSVPIATGTTSASFATNWQEGSATFTLIEPGGRLIDPAVAVIDPNIEYGDHAFGASYGLTNPRPGVWLVRVTPGSGVPVSGTPCQLVGQDSAVLEVTPGAPVVTPLSSSARFTVRLRSKAATLNSGSASGVLVRPDGSRTDVTFFDDGQHGDGAANDGLYGTPLVSANQVGTYGVYGHVSGSAPGLGSAQRAFSVSFDASPGTASIVGLNGFSAFEDPNDPDSYIDMLNVGVNVQVNAPGDFTLSADLCDKAGRVADTADYAFSATQTGGLLVTLPFEGQVIGEHDADGPFTVRRVRLTDDSGSVAVTTDYLAVLGTSTAYSKLEFETIHPRAVAPVGYLREGLNLVSLPLQPLPSYSGDFRQVFGKNAAPDATLAQRGRGFYLKYQGTPPSPVSLLGTQDEPEFPVHVATAGTTLLGCPYNRPLPLSRVLVERAGAMRTAEQDAAHASPWVNWNWQYLEGGVWKSCRLTGGQDDQLRPWYGYRVTTLVDGLTLTLRD